MTRKNLLLNIFWTFLYAMLTLFLVLHHEIWADEAQVWLIVKNLSIFGMFEHLVNEGHPCFFYLLVYPLAKMNFSIFSMQLLCWFSCVVGVFLLLNFSPFSKFAKASIVLSSGFFYFLPVIARSYSILPLLIFTAAILYEKVQKNPQKYSIPYALILAFIANTHVIMFVFVAVLACFFVYDNFVKQKNMTKQTISSCAIVGFALFAVIVQLLGTFASNAAISFSFDNVLVETFKTVSIFFLNSIGLVYKSVYNPIRFTPIAIIAAVVMFFMFLLCMVQLAANNKRMFLLALGAIGFQFFIYIFSYKAMLYQTRIFGAYLILIFCFWIVCSQDEVQQKFKIFSKKFLNIMMGIFFILTFVCGIHAALLDVFYNYSSAGETAEFLRKNTEPDSVIIPNFIAFPLAVYEKLPERKYYDTSNDRFLTYVIWKDRGYYSDKEFDFLIEKNIKEKKFKHTYVIASSLLHLTQFEKVMPQKYKLIYTSPPAIATGEAFRVYKYIGPIKN